MCIAILVIWFRAYQLVTTIIAFAAKDAQRVADDLNKVGLVYNAGEGITIDEIITSTPMLPKAI